MRSTGVPVSSDSVGNGGVARSQLAGAVAEAGGFGCLGMVRESPALIAREIKAHSCCISRIARVPHGYILIFLYEAADAIAEATLRSAQKQLEYWVQLGRLADGMLSNVEAVALLSHESFISDISLRKNVVPRAEDVMAQIQQDRADGTLKAKVTQTPIVYDVADDGISIRRIDAAGNATVGSLVDGNFVQAAATSSRR